jgi:hypothetical protein
MMTSFDIFDIPDISDNLSKKIFFLPERYLPFLRGVQEKNPLLILKKKKNLLFLTSLDF